MLKSVGKYSTDYAWIQYLEDGEYVKDDPMLNGVRFKGQYDIVKQGSSLQNKVSSFSGKTTSDIIREPYKGASEPLKGEVLFGIINGCYIRLKNDMTQASYISGETLDFLKEFQNEPEEIKAKSHIMENVRKLADKYIELQNSVRRDQTIMISSNLNENSVNKVI